MGGAQLSSDQVMAVSAYVWALNHRKSAPAAKSPTTGELLVPGERIFIGSIGARRVFVVKPGTTSAEPWTEVDSEAPAGTLGVFADDKSNTLWACCSAIGPDGVPSAGKRVRGRIT